MPAATPETPGAPDDGRAAATPPGAQAARGGPLDIDDLGERFKPVPAPERLGGFRIVGKLGEGGMGVVYQAVQESLNRSVALKVVKADFARNRAFVARFLREARVAASIDHPNVVAIYDTGEADGHLYMALQHVTGGDLHGRLVAGGPLAEREALRVAVECARGLKAIHQAGLVHRDVKPSNIFFAADGTVKIGDLGLVRQVQGDQKLTFSGDLVGTPAYMSPEQALAEADIDGRADLYALGASLYHLVTGQAPFGASSPFLVGHQVLAELAPDPRELNPRVSRETAAIVHHALRKDRAARYQSADEMIEDLELVRAGKPPRHAQVASMQAERRATLADQVGHLTAEGPRRRLIPALIAMAVVLAVAAALLIGLNLARGPRTPSLPELPVEVGRTGFPIAPPSDVPEPAPTPLPDAILDHEATASAAPVAKVETKTATAPAAAAPTAPVPAAASGDAARSAPTASVAQPATPPPVTEPRPETPPQPVAPEIAAAPPAAAPPAAVPVASAAPSTPAASIPVAPHPATSASDGAAPQSVVLPEITPFAPTPLAGTDAPPAAGVAPAPIEQALADAAGAPSVGTAPAAVAPAPEARRVRSVPRWAVGSGADRFGVWATFSVGPAQQRLRLCPAGRFTIGSPADEPGRKADEGMHRVEIAQAYWLADTECTQTLWKTVMGTRPSSVPGDDLPVDNVSWRDCQEFCAKLSAMVPGLRARLPGEAEWEAACRAGSRGPFSGGLALGTLGWSAANSGGAPHEPATRRANDLGLYDMHGNVWEWCQDLDPGYPDAASRGADERMFRGGAWNSRADSCRAAQRGGNAIGAAAPGVGLRIAVDVDAR